MWYPLKTSMHLDKMHHYATTCLYTETKMPTKTRVCVYMDMPSAYCLSLSPIAYYVLLLLPSGHWTEHVKARCLSFLLTRPGKGDRGRSPIASPPEQWDTMGEGAGVRWKVGPFGGRGRAAGMKGGGNHVLMLWSGMGRGAGDGRGNNFSRLWSPKGSPSYSPSVPPTSGAQFPKVISSRS